MPAGQAVRVFSLDSEQWFERTLQEVFPFFADPRNLETITPPWLHFEIATHGEIRMRRGTMIDYRLRLHGIPLAWRSEITVWDPPFRFVDEQVRGPYRLWRHKHRFLTQDGRSRVLDHVDYAVLGGRFVRNLFVARELERIFEFRRRKLKEIFGERRA
jgi:ligand-binding SRPBCC domain-containing protein